MAKTPTERTLAWRAKNPDKYREYQRELMRRKRQEENKLTEKPSAPASSVLALIKSKLPASAPVLPRGTPILAPKAKVKPEKKGDAS